MENEIIKKDLNEVVNKLFNAIYNKYQITEHQIKSSSRKRPIVSARRIVCALIKEECPKTKVKKLGAIVGRKHPNVCIQLREHINLANSDRDYNMMFHNIRNEYFKK
jgi:chromosomal replication initiation ATPase DnaA